MIGDTSKGTVQPILVCVCMCAAIHRICVCIYIYIYVCTYGGMYVIMFLYVCTYACMQVGMYACVFRFIYVWMDVCRCSLFIWLAGCLLVCLFGCLFVCSVCLTAYSHTSWGPARAAAFCPTMTHRHPSLFACFGARSSGLRGLSVERAYQPGGCCFNQSLAN